jgi:hypothetical protein
MSRAGAATPARREEHAEAGGHRELSVFVHWVTLSGTAAASRANRNEYGTTRSLGQGCALLARPPSCRSGSWVLADHDEVAGQSFCMRHDGLDRLTMDEIRRSGDATLFQPSDGFVENAPITSFDVFCTHMSGDSRKPQALVDRRRNYREQGHRRTHIDGEFRTMPQSAPSLVRTVVAQKNVLEHLLPARRLMADQSAICREAEV